MESELQSTVMFMKHCSPITKEVSYMVQECMAESSVPCLGQVIDFWTESFRKAGSHWGLGVESSPSALAYTTGFILPFEPPP